MLKEIFIILYSIFAIINKKWFSCLNLRNYKVVWNLECKNSKKNPFFLLFFIKVLQWKLSHLLCFCLEIPFVRNKKAEVWAVLGIQYVRSCHTNDFLEIYFFSGVIVLYSTEVCTALTSANHYHWQCCGSGSFSVWIGRLPDPNPHPDQRSKMTY
jgi:hypothetical protein